MKVFLKKSIKIGDIKLNKDDAGFIRAYGLDSKKGNYYLVDFGEHTFIHIDAGLVEMAPPAKQ